MECFSIPTFCKKENLILFQRDLKVMKIILSRTEKGQLLKFPKSCHINKAVKALRLNFENLLGPQMEVYVKLSHQSRMYEVFLSTLVIFMKGKRIIGDILCVVPFSSDFSSR